jgi:hypothetical protein
MNENCVSISVIIFCQSQSLFIAGNLTQKEWFFHSTLELNEFDHFTHIQRVKISLFLSDFIHSSLESEFAHSFGRVNLLTLFEE